MTAEKMCFFIMMNGFDCKGLHEMKYAQLETYYLKCKKEFDAAQKKKKEEDAKPKKRIWD